MTEFGIVTLVQARAGSSRLKGKALLPLAGRPILHHVLERAAAIGWPVVLATSVSAQDDRVARLGTKCGVRVYRGDEQDVLGRLSEAAREAGARIVIRVTGDCPLLAPDVAQDVLALCVQAGYSPSRSFIATNDTRTSGWPDGMDVEVFHAGDLHEAAEQATKESDREHVTPWLRRRLTHVVLPGPPETAPSLRLSVDTKGDYERINAVYAHLASGELGWRATFAAARLVEGVRKSGLESGAAATREAADTSPSDDGVPPPPDSPATTPLSSDARWPSSEPGNGEIRLSPPAIAALRREGLTQKEAAAKTDDELIAMSGIGAATIAKLREAFGLASHR